MADNTLTPGKVFISYARDDGRKFAIRLHKDLEDAGVRAFLDELDMKSGQNINFVVQSNLMNARAVLAVLTPASSLCDFVGGESGHNGVVWK